MKNLAFFILFAGISPLQAATFSYLFTVDTSSLSTQADNVDFQLNPGGLTSPAVTVQISNFLLMGGSYTPANIQLTGDASGLLPASLTLDNGMGYNDAFQPVTLGTSLRFVATFSGAGVDTPGNPGTFFGFSIYDNAGTTPLLTTSTDGTVSGVNLDSVNGVQPFTNPATPGGASAGMVTTVTSTPEPGTWIGLLSGSVLLGLRRLRRR